MSNKLGSCCVRWDDLEIAKTVPDTVPDTVSDTVPDAITYITNTGPVPVGQQHACQVPDADCLVVSPS